MATEHLAWLDIPHVQKILQNAEEDESIVVSDISSKPATAKGDNYCSSMHRVTVEFSRVKSGHVIEGRKSLIVKTTPEDAVILDMVEAVGIFDTELSVISTTLPKMNEILEEADLPPLGARCLYAQYERPTHMFIEDLAPLGFRMADRHAGLDLDHCLLAVRNIAKFHASSIALKEKDPTAFENYTKGMVNKDHQTAIGDFFDKAAKSLAQESTKWPELNPRIPEKLGTLSNNFYEKGCEATLYQEDDFNVLNHGDFWINNMLFEYDESQRPIGLMFVDFQFTHYGSAAIDILYFLGSSPTDDVRLHHREQLIREYHTCLTSTMAELKCHMEPPSFGDIERMLKKRAFCEPTSAISILHLVVLEKGTEIDYQKVKDDYEGYANPAYCGKSYRKIMTRLLPWYDSMGLLDV